MAVHRPEKARFIALKNEWDRLEEAWKAYARAMNHRESSFLNGGNMVHGHTSNVSNSEQRQIDDLRKAIERFGKKTGIFDIGIGSKISEFMFNHREELQDNALL